MTKHTISEKVKDNLIYSNDMSKSLYTNIGFSKSPLRKGDSIADIAAKIFNLIKLNQIEHTKQVELDKNFNFKLIEKQTHEEHEAQKTFAKIDEDPKKVLEKDTENEEDSSFGIGKIFSIYKFWKMLNLGQKISKLFEFINVFKNLKWIKNISSIPMNIVRGAFEIVKAAFPRLLAVGRFIPGPIGTALKIGAGVTTAYGLSKLIASGESGAAAYDAANRGLKDDSTTEIRKYSGVEKFSEMSVGEISRRQHLPRNDPDYISAVGKYQMIRITMDEAISLGFVKKSDIFSPEVQENLFSEYLVKAKRPEIVKYLEASPNDPEIINGTLLDKALAGLSNEFASVEYKSGSGVSISGQKASISAENASAELLAMRNETQNKKLDVSDIASKNTDMISPNVTGEKLNKDSVENIDIKKETDAHLHIQQVPTNYILGTNSSPTNFEFISSNPIPPILQKLSYE